MERVLTLLVVLSACTVSFPPDGAPYPCTTAADCGGGEAKCVGDPQRCCIPTAEETGALCTDGIDNDCDGHADSTDTVEICNGLDDNCNNATDEGFNLNLDPMNCGSCGHMCAAAEVCVGRVCTIRRETICSDGLDNDVNGKTDCQDPQCEGFFCGAGCACKALAKSEAGCNDAMDNDDDLAIDCLDTDCEGRSCGTGCACSAGGGKKETSCNDALDNDGDGMIDCTDSDCLNLVCTPGGTVFFTCTATGQCKCNGGTQVSETGTRCDDGIDNNCDGIKDCAETSCDGQDCTRDAGMGMCVTLMCMP